MAGRFGMNLSRLVVIGCVFLCYSNFLKIEADYMVIPALSTEYHLPSQYSYQVPQLVLNEPLPNLPVWTPPNVLEKESHKQNHNTQIQPSTSYEAPNQNQFVENNYGPPVIEAPAPTYGKPVRLETTALVPTESYGPPKSSVFTADPLPTYGPPKPSVFTKDPLPTYGPPKPSVFTQDPLPTYGPPKPKPSKAEHKPVEPSPVYGAPGKTDSVASSSYGPPKPKPEPLPVYGAVAPYSYLEDNENDIDDQPVTGLGLYHGTYSHPLKALGSPLVAQLRERLSHLELNPWYLTDNMLARYIELVDFRVEKAVILLERTARWRQNNKVDHKLDEVPSELLANSFPYECTGITDDGLPVIYLPVGKWDFRKVRRAGLGSQISKYLARMLEDIRNATVGRKNPKTGEPIDQVVIIENMDGFSLTNFLTLRHNHFKIAARYLRNLDRHYPFLAKRYIVLKTPLLIQAGWTVFRKTTPRLRKSLRVYNRFSIKGPEDLVHNVPKHAIPVELGGAFVSLVTAASGHLVQEQVW